jgi:hypothetical protein
VVSLDTLAPGEAAGLLARLASRADVTADDPAVGQVVALCGYLPLALGMAGRQLAHHPAWTPAGLAGDLAAARDRLELMAAENLSVAAAFGLSYADLDEGQQKLFRRLGLHPGPDIDAYAAAALEGSGLAAARRHLGALYDQHLITEPAHGRYQLHDLLREHARTLALPATGPIQTRRSAGCWTTTSTLPWPPTGTWPPGPAPPAAHRPATRQPTLPPCPPSIRQQPGLMLSGQTCTRPPTTPPAMDGPSRTRQNGPISAPATVGIPGSKDIQNGGYLRTGVD